MLIREFTENPDLKDVDLLDDLHFFMHNDPKFYRRALYPLIARFRDHIKSGKKCNDLIFRPCVDRATHEYCKKFNIPDSEKSVFTDVDRDQLARKIFAQEQEHINQGHYDGESQ
jgi:hypothetical protein